MKLILITILTIFCVNNLHAQSHNYGGNFNCKLKKGNFLNSEKHACPACEQIEKKEKAAKAAEDKRRADAIVAKAKAERDERQLAWEAKKTEDAKNKNSGEVLINMPKSIISNSNASKPEAEENLKYSAVQERNNPREENDQYYRTTHPVKILRDKQIVYESNDYQSIRQPRRGKLIFVLRAVSGLPGCKAEESNNSILINEKGKQIPLPGIDKFGIFFSNRENDDYFDIAVFTGECTPVKDDRYAKGDWHTTIYTFSYTTMGLIGSKPSWQHANCECN